MKVSEVEENDRGTRGPRMGKDIPFPSFLVSHPLGTENSEMTNKILYVNCLHKDDPPPFSQIQGFLFIRLFSRRFVCQSVCACVKIHVAVRGQPWAGVFLSCCPSFILRWGLFPNLRLTSSLDGLGRRPQRLPQCWGYSHTLVTLTLCMY